MSEFILLLTTASERWEDELLGEMRSRFPDHSFGAAGSTDELGDCAAPVQGTAGDHFKPGRLDPVEESLVDQVATEFTIVLEAAKARKLQ